MNTVLDFFIISTLSVLTLGVYPYYIISKVRIGLNNIDDILLEIKNDDVLLKIKNRNDTLNTTHQIRYIQYGPSNDNTDHQMNKRGYNTFASPMPPLPNE